MSMAEKSLLNDVLIQRGETQKNVNFNVLEFLTKRFKKDNPLKVLDLPCGSMLFLGYLRTFFPKSILTGADIITPVDQKGCQFIEMDLAKEFSIAMDEKYDLITSISGVMMFGNTSAFVANAARRLKKDGLFIITNDNSISIKDKLSFLFFSRHRLFKAIYEDTEAITQNVSIQELTRLLRTNGCVIEKIMYTSSYWRDVIFLPLALLIYPLQFIHLRLYKTKLPAELISQMYPFSHYLCKHYIIFSRKISLA